MEVREYNGGKKRSGGLLRERNVGMWMLLLMCMLMLTGCREKKEKGGIYNMEIRTENGIEWDEGRAAQIEVDGEEYRAAVHYRGGWTSRYPKYSIAIKLSSADSLCGLPKARKWALNASYADHTFMRHKMAFELFREFDENNRAPYCAYSLVSVDGEKRGLFVLMQRMDEYSIGVVEEDTSVVIFKEPPLMYGDTIEEKEYNPYNQKYPPIRKSDRAEEYVRLRHIIYDTPDSFFYEAAEEAIDMRNIVDWHIIILFSNNSDGILKGYYLYKASDEERFRVALWDYDHGFGRDGDGEYNMLRECAEVERSPMFERLMKQREYRERLKARWWELRENSLSEERLHEKIEKERETLRKAAKQDRKINPKDRGMFHDMKSFDGEVDIIEEFIDKNLERLDAYFDTLS